MADVNIDLKFWVALNRVPHLGPARFQRLEAHFGDLERVWRASPSDLRAAGIESRPAREILDARPKIDPDAEMERLEIAGVQALNWNHPLYPPRLREIHDPPPVLYVKGNLEPGDERAMAVVGTRSPTSYGRDVATTLVNGLSRNSICIISGLARGIDGVAHRAALEAGGRTIAVVANGLDTVYPPEHGQLARQVQEQGALVSEYPLGTRPDSRNFPRRNRLISGMSLGTLVVEAAEGSGARWTVYHALEQDREVFCVPGSIFSPASRFTNRMIQEGAKLVSDYSDMLVELNLEQFSRGTDTRRERQVELPFLPADSETRAAVNGKEADREGANRESASPEELDLLAHLGTEPMHIDDLGREAGLPITSVSCTLTMLELKGMVKQVGCMHYVNVTTPREVSPVYGR